MSNAGMCDVVMQAYKGGCFKSFRSNIYLGNVSRIECDTKMSWLDGCILLNYHDYPHVFVLASTCERSNRDAVCIQQLLCVQDYLECWLHGDEWEDLIWKATNHIFDGQFCNTHVVVVFRDLLAPSWAH
jgi:hypothetical protein